MQLSRRHFIKGSAALSLLTVPKLLRAIPLCEKKLSLYHIHTGEWFKETIVTHASVCHSIQQKMNHFMRDWRINAAHDMDPNLTALLLDIKDHLPTHTSFDIICGYRSSETNRALRSKSSHVAKNSLHCKGKAIDFSCPNVNLKKLATIAQDLQRGGVGRYTSSGFIHVDIRPKPARWGS